MTGETVQDLLDVMGGYLHLDDVGHVWFSLAVAVSAEFDGDPLWGMVIGAPSSGKTETIRGLDHLADHVDDLTAPALLTWQAGRNKQPGRKTGVLTRIGERGFVTVGDFSTILATSDRGGRDQLFSLLRRAYDGSVTRDLASAPGPLIWEGRLTLLAACSPAIDNYASHEAALGPRWVYYRLPRRDTGTKRKTSQKARHSAGQLNAHRAAVADLAAVVVKNAQGEQPSLPSAFGHRLDDLAIVACYGRAAVPRNGYGQREIDGMAVIEEPPRLVGQLTMLARGLIALGMGEADTLALCRRVAIDSIPEPRRQLLEALADDGARLSVSEAARRAGCHRHVARRSLEDLQAIGLVDTLESDEIDGMRWQSDWWLDGDDMTLIRSVMRADLWHEVCLLHPHSPPI